MLITEHIRAVAQIANTTAADIVGPSRVAFHVRPRWALMLAMRESGMSLPGIGRHLNRHHTTVMDGIRQAQRLRSRDPLFDQLCRSIAALTPIRERDE